MWCIVPLYIMSVVFSIYVCKIGDPCGSSDTPSLCTSICFFSDQPEEMLELWERAVHSTSILLSLRLCLFIASYPSVFHVPSTHQQQWCAVTTMRTSLHSSVCLHTRPQWVLFPCVCILVCIKCVCAVCAEYRLLIKLISLSLCWGFSSRIYQWMPKNNFSQMYDCVWVSSHLSPLVDICHRDFWRPQSSVSVFCFLWSPPLSSLISQVQREEFVLKSTTSQKTQTLTMTGQSTSYVSWQKQ